MGLTIYQVDAFTEKPFSGNPAAVCLLTGPEDAPPHLIEALGIPATYIGKNVFDYLVEVESEEIVRNMKPDLVLLAQVTARGVMVTSRASSPGFDFVSRFFAPQVGINEDPV